MTFENNRVVQLSSVVAIKTGYPFKSKDYSSSGEMRLVRGDNVVQGKLRWDDAKYWPVELIDGLNEFALEENDVVLAMDRPWIEAGLKYARMAKEDLPALLVQRVSRLRAKTLLNQRFLFYVIGSKEFTQYILAIQTGTAVPHISAKQIGDFEFPLPPIEEQQRTADILGTIDDKIELNRRMNVTLEAMAQALFKAWFVDFDPVKAKAARRAPEGMDADTATLFPSEFQDSELGPIPKGWSAGTFRDCCERVESGGTPSRKNPEYWENGTIPWLTSSEVRNPIVYDTKEYISEEGLKGSSAKLWPAGTTVVAMYGATAGEVCLLAGSLTANQACCALIPKEGFRCFLFLQAVRSKNDLAGKASGSAQQNLNQSLVAQFGTVLPNQEIADAYENQASSLVDKWIANDRESECLRKLRDALLPKLISGQLRIPAGGCGVGSLPAPHPQ